MKVFILLSCYGKYRVVKDTNRSFIDGDMFIKEFDELDKAVNYCDKNNMTVIYTEC